jgi:hypothetical protein
MPISQIEAITFANQNMQVVASKQSDNQNRVEFQKYVAAAKIAEKEITVADINELESDKMIESQREHNKEESEKQSGAKAKETKIEFKLKAKKEIDDLADVDGLVHILDIKV